MQRGDGLAFKEHLAMDLEGGEGGRKEQRACNQVQSAGWGGSTGTGIEVGTSAQGGKRGGWMWKWGMEVDFQVRGREHKAHEGGRQER